MPINTGVIEATWGDVTVRVHYDSTLPASLDQPLIDNPATGLCLELWNPNPGKPADLTLTAPGLSPMSIKVRQGLPVTSGPPSGRSRTAAQLATLGILTRGQANITLGPG